MIPPGVEVGTDASGGSSRWTCCHWGLRVASLEPLMAVPLLILMTGHSRSWRNAAAATGHWQWQCQHHNQCLHQQWQQRTLQRMQIQQLRPP